MARQGWTEGCTFKPELSQKAKRLSRPGTASDRLYDPDWVKKRNSAQMNDPLNSLLANADFDFKPHINASPRAAAASPRAAAAGEGGQRRGSLGALDIITTSGTSGSRPATAPQDGITFVSPRASTEPEAAVGVLGVESPRTPTGKTARSPIADSSGAGGSGSKPASAAGGGGGSGRKIVFDRLFSEGARHKARMEAAKARAAEAELAGVTFRPDTAASKASAVLSGVRLGASGGEGGEVSGGRSAARSPALSGAGSRGTDADGEGKEAFSRLYKHALALKERQKARQSAPPPIDPACTFAPELNPTSRKLAEAAAHAHIGIEEGDVSGGGGGTPISGAGAGHGRSRIESLYAEGIQKVRLLLWDEGWIIWLNDCRACFAILSETGPLIPRPYQCIDVLLLVLYARAQIQERSKESRNKAGQPREEELKECTFKPVVNALPALTSPSPKAAAAAAAVGVTSSSTRASPTGDGVGTGGAAAMTQSTVVVPMMGAHERLYAHAVHKRELYEAAASGAPLEVTSFASSLRSSPGSPGANSAARHAHHYNLAALIGAGGDGGAYPAQSPSRRAALSPSAHGGRLTPMSLNRQQLHTETSTTPRKGRSSNNGGTSAGSQPHSGSFRAAAAQAPASAVAASPAPLLTLPTAPTNGDVPAKPQSAPIAEIVETKMAAVVANAGSEEPIST